MNILFWIVLLFLVVNCFNMAKWILCNNDPEISTWYWLVPIADLAVITNSSVNFIIYCLFGSDFRAELIMMFKSTMKEARNFSSKLEQKEAEAQKIVMAQKSETV